MHKYLLNALLATPAVLGAALALSPAMAVEAAQAGKAEQQAVEALTQDAAVAEAPVADAAKLAMTPAEETAQAEAPVQVANLDQLQRYSNEGKGVVAYEADAVDQVTSVSQLSDVQPTDWAFQALQSLVERYGCIAGYPDGTYKGNRALTRYEFAAGVNACLDRVNELIAAGTTGLATKEDLATLQKLQEEFAAELATIRGQVDALEARTAELEANQFSTTTKLAGEVIFTIADTFGDRTGEDQEDETETIFANRVRLNFDTSFTGKDRLRTRLQARNITPFAGGLTGTNMTRLSYDDSEENDVVLDELFYRFPVGSNLTLQIDADNVEVYDALVDPISPFASSGSGAMSRLGRFSPFYRHSTAQGAGLSARYRLAEAFTIEAAYAADNDSNDPSEENGLFNGNFAAFAQLVFSPSKNFKAALGYSRRYFAGTANLTGSTGSAFSANPFGNNVEATADAFSGAVQFGLSSQLTVGGWFSAFLADEIDSDNEATIITAAAYLAFRDFVKEGSLTGLLVALPPKATDNDVDAREDEDTSIHVELFHRFPVNDNISITPGLFVIFNPEHNNDNDTQFVGAIRTTFTF
jgi:hypothetical protein